MQSETKDLAASQPAACHAPRLPTPPTLDGVWDKPAWRNAPTGTLANFMGARPAHFPKTQFRVGYDDAALYVIFRVEDRYVRAAAAKQFQDNVCRDSCVEFFFTPGPDIKAGYFNIEINCGGALLLHWQTVPRKGQLVKESDCAKIEVFHQLPRQIDPEIAEPTTWTLEYRAPLAMLENYAPVARPAPGVIWRANFYKCADATSHPHWLTYFPVRLPKPDFHTPDWFGLLEFTV